MENEEVESLTGCIYSLLFFFCPVGEKPYECSNCKKRFSHSGSYSSHLSSKKCHSGGGNGNGNAGGAGGAFNGHSQNPYQLSLLPSPSAGRGRNNNDKGSPLSLQNHNNSKSLVRVPEEAHQLMLQDPSQNPAVLTKALDLSQLWDPPTDLPLRASILKGTNLLPYPYSGTKFEQMIQDVLHKEAKREDQDKGGAEVEERRVMNNVADLKRKLSPEKRESGEAERGVLGVTCRWCSQLFPNVAVLLQHERYLCKLNLEAVEVPRSLGDKDNSSPPLFFPRSGLQVEHSKPCEVANGLSGSKSPLHKPSWHSVPQQLLVAMHSPPQPCHESLSSHPFWSRPEKGSPTQQGLHSPDLLSPKAKRRVSSSGFTSPICLDLTSCPPDILPQNQNGGSWSAQNEPLDLSLPKQPADKEGKNPKVNGSSARREKRDLETQQLKRLMSNLSPTSQLPFHHPIYGGARAPVFPGPMYNSFPIISQSGFSGLSGHDAMARISFSQQANSSGFLSPLTYMMEADAEAALKKIHQERHALMVRPLFEMGS